MEQHKDEYIGFNETKVPFPFLKCPVFHISVLLNVSIHFHVSLINNAKAEALKFVLFWAPGLAFYLGFIFNIKLGHFWSAAFDLRVPFSTIAD